MSLATRQQTPWGVADHHKPIADGIDWFSTPSHGGFRVSPERLTAMPAQYRKHRTWAGEGWYEEDCDWAIVVLSFPEFFPAEDVQTAAKMYASMSDYFTKRAA